MEIRNAKEMSSIHQYYVRSGNEVFFKCLDYIHTCEIYKVYYMNPIGEPPDYNMLNFREVDKNEHEDRCHL